MVPTLRLKISGAKNWWILGKKNGECYMTYERAKEIVLRKYPDSNVVASFKIQSGYVFSIKPKTWNDKEYVLDGFFKVSSDAGKITEYSPVMDPEEFKQALKNRIE